MPTISELESQVEVLNRRNAELELAVTGLERKHQQGVLRSAIMAGAHAVGIHPQAIDDVVDAALRTGSWHLDGAGQPYHQVDGPPDVDAKTGRYLSPAEWVKTKLRKTSPHFFVDAEDTGTGSSSTAPGGVRNPWLSQFWNMSEQGNLYRRDRALAEKLAADAGSRVGAHKPTR